MKIRLLQILIFTNFFINAQDSIPDFIQRYKLENSKADLKVFVGEKIEVKEIIYESNYAILVDSKYSAKYKVIKNIYGQIKTDTITFVAFDHYGTPVFSKYKNALLYIKKVGDDFFHCKYQYNPVFMTNNNRWAGPYSTYDYGRKVKANSKIKPEIINFKDSVNIDFENYPIEDAKRWFPEPYYKIKGNKAIAIYGNFVNDLFELKKEGILKRRGYFK